MSKATAFLEANRQMLKRREGMIKRICEENHLSLIQGNIITFLYNNPEKDTARDIVELRMLSKGNVSRAIEELIQKQLLKRKADAKDRRIIHLELLPAAAPIMKQIIEEQEKFQKEVYSGFTEEEIQNFTNYIERIHKNILQMERGEQNE